MKTSLTILSVVVFFFIGTYSADSMCVYNRSSTATVPPGLGTFKVDFDCGMFCNNTWLIQKTCPPPDGPNPGCTRCRYGKAGIIFAVYLPPNCPPTCPEPPNSCKTKVEAHGWVEVTGGRPGGFSPLTCTPFK